MSETVKTKYSADAVIRGHVLLQEKLRAGLEEIRDYCTNHRNREYSAERDRARLQAWAVLHRQAEELIALIPQAPKAI